MHRKVGKIIRHDLHGCSKSLTLSQEIGDELALQGKGASERASGEAIEQVDE